MLPLATRRTRPLFVALLGIVWLLYRRIRKRAAASISAPTLAKQPALPNGRMEGLKDEEARNVAKAKKAEEDRNTEKARKEAEEDLGWVDSLSWVGLAGFVVGWLVGWLVGLDWLAPWLASLGGLVGWLADVRKAAEAKKVEDAKMAGDSQKLKQAAEIDAAKKVEVLSEKIQHAERPNFSGSWLIVRDEGDTKAFFEDMGVGFLKLKLLATFNYGVGKMTHIINHTGDDITIIAKGPKGSVKQEFKIDGTDQGSVDTADGTPLRIKPVWDGSILDMTTTKAGAPWAKVRRYLRGQEMILEMTSPANKVTLSRVMQRND